MVLGAEWPLIMVAMFWPDAGVKDDCGLQPLILSTGNRTGTGSAERTDFKRKEGV